MNIIGYLIDADKPYAGHTQSILYKDDEGVERVAYTGKARVVYFSGDVMQEGEPDLTLSEYLHERGGRFKTVSEAQLDEMNSRFNESLKSNPEPITKEQYNHWLNCLPPCRFYSGGVEFFHISERLRGDIVQWCLKIGKHHFAFTDDASISHGDIADHIVYAKGLVHESLSRLSQG